MTAEVVPPLIPPNAYTGLFQTENTAYTATVSGLQRILIADSRRIYVWIRTAAAVITATEVMPGPWPTGYVSTTTGSISVKAKFHDAPSFTQGEWYGQMDLGTVLLISECLYVGG